MSHASTLYLVTPRADARVLESLRKHYPALRILNGGAEVPLDGCAPEEVLSACRAVGLTVRGSRVTRIRMNEAVE
ncbi:MAG: hypothetical protein ABJD11_01810 [Gemmatimonadota bacterium]